MKMSELHPGMVVELTDRGGRHGKRRVIGRKVKVLATAVKRDSSAARYDRVQVVHMHEDENGELVEQTDSRGKRWVRLYMARELVSLEEAAQIRAENEAKQEKARRKRYEQDVVGCFLESQVAMRLGISRENIRSSVTTDNNDEPLPWRVVIDAAGAAAVLANDDDAAMIEAALAEIPGWTKMSRIELAEAIVGYLRNGHSE